MEWLNPLTAWAQLQDFLNSGGWVLYVIMASTFLMWTLIVERFWYFLGAFPRIAKNALETWQARSDHSSWHAHKIRTMLIADVAVQTRQNIPMINILVAVSPMLGLLGTVSGMVELFDILAITGANNARALASGVFKATLPTMAGMVAALSGLYLSNLIEKRASREIEKVADQMELQ